MTPVVLLDGIGFPEGPRWHDGRWWFSDMDRAVVCSVGPSGELTIEQEVPARPSGLGWRPDGTRLVVSMEDRRLVDAAGATVADLSGLAGWHCNDMVVTERGDAYVGNFGFDLHGGGRFTTASLVLVPAVGGPPRVVADRLAFPNGTVVTPDDSTLVVAETFGRTLTAFAIAGDGSLGDRRVWADVTPHTPDGICLDAEGAVWLASPTTSAFVRVAEGGEVLDLIDLDPGHWAVACMLGGPDGHDLLLCCADTDAERSAAHRSDGYLLMTRAEAPHAGRP